MRHLSDLRDLDRRTLQIVRQNYGMSIAVNGAGPPWELRERCPRSWRPRCTTPPSVAVAVDSARPIRYPGTVAEGPQLS